ncbi:MAG TPA: inositol monophosphatase family protein [Bdellovibrionota bacterium]|jgi:myo-inositol-1(or 4)-monophosphatase
MKKPELERIRKAAVEAAVEAGKVTLRYYRKRLQVREKARSSLVTEADLKSEALIRKLLGKKFPGFQFRGEEGGANASASPDAPMWHVDPLDGTTNFVHGFPMYCVSIGLALAGEPLVGVVHIPTLDETIHGAKGCGARLNRKPLQVSRRSGLSDCLLTTGFAYLHKPEAISPEIERFKQAHLEARAVRRPGAAAIDLAYVAAGVFDGFWERNLSSWDVCAGILLVREAGGRVTDYSGKSPALDGREILATNGLVHDAMIKILAN